MRSERSEVVVDTIDLQILKILSQCVSLNRQEIFINTGITHPTLLNHFKRLEGNKLIALFNKNMVVGARRRKYTVYSITDKGKELIELFEHYYEE